MSKKDNTDSSFVVRIIIGEKQRSYTACDSGTREKTGEPRPGRGGRRSTGEPSDSRKKNQPLALGCEGREKEKQGLTGFSIYIFLRKLQGSTKKRPDGSGGT